MNDMQIVIAIRIGIAALIGLATGLEREWSGHATGPDARFAGLRTFTLLGVLGGIVGALTTISQSAIAAAIALGAAGLCVVGYAVAARRPAATTDGTTEAAALTIVGLGVLAGLGWLQLAAAAGALLVFILREKERMHWMVQRLDEREIRAGVQFAVLAVVVLPLLPTGPFFGPIALQPRSLWAIVLLFSGLNFAGYVARRIVGASRGLGISGALGGMISSTAVTLTFSRQSRSHASLGAPLALGVIAACTVLIPRVVIVSATLNSAVALALIPLLLPALIAGLALAAFAWRHRTQHDGTDNDVDEANPLRLGAAIPMALAFQIAIIIIGVVRSRWGTPGVYTTAAMLGLTDVDALTVSMSRPAAALAPDIAARAIAIGILANTALKTAIIVSLGRDGFRRRASASLAAMAAASALGLLLA
jgi:uncharacterized membrane protein (DUF4010 family)